MKITSPQGMTSDISKVEKVVSEFEERFAKEEKDEKYYHLVIVGECNRQTCDEVERIYKESGWSKVECSTSSAKGERYGLTGLQLYR